MEHVGTRSDPMSIASMSDIGGSSGGGFNAGTFSIPNLPDYLYPRAMWIPMGNSTTSSSIGVALSAAGTATSRNVTSANALTQLKRLAYVSAATAPATVVHRSQYFQHTLGNGAVGGFLSSQTFGIADAAAVSGARMFVGMTSAALGNVEPSTLTNVVGVGHGAADSNLKIYFGGSVAQPPIDLGADFPISPNTDAYRLTLYAPQDPIAAGFKLGWQVARLGTSIVASGTFNYELGAQLPSASTLLSFIHLRTNNATAKAVALDLGAMTLIGL